MPRSDGRPCAAELLGRNGSRNRLPDASAVATTLVLGRVRIVTAGAGRPEAGVLVDGTADPAEQIALAHVNRVPKTGHWGPDQTTDSP